MSVSIQHEAASSISSSDSSSDSDNEPSSKVHPDDLGGDLREENLTKTVDEIKALQDEIEREIQKLSNYLNDAAISKIRKDAQTIIAIRDEINYINGLMGITNDQTQQHYYFLPTKHDNADEHEVNLRQAILRVERVRERVQKDLESTLNVDGVMWAHKEIITTILDIDDNDTIRETDSNAYTDLKASMSELQALSLKWFHDRFSNEGENYGKNDAAYDRKKDSEAFRSLYHDRDDKESDKTENKVHISPARLEEDEGNFKLYKETSENITKMGKNARLIGRINTDRLIVNGKLSQTQNSGKEIKWTEADKQNTEWEGMKLELTDQLEVTKLHHVYRASKVGKHGTSTDAEVKGDDDGDSKEDIFEKVIFKETQAEVYKLVEPFLMSALNDQNIGIFMYGGTHSGKTYTSFGEGNDDDRGIVSRMIEAIENRKVEQVIADNMYRTHHGNDNPRKENLGVSVRCFEIYGRANGKGITSEYNVYDLIQNKGTFSDDKKPSAKSTLYRYKKNIGMNQYYPKDIDLNKLNEVWYEAEGTRNFTKVDYTEPGFHFEELSTTFIDKKLVVTSSGENIELATYMQKLLKDYRRVYPTKYNDESSRGHCIFQITLEHHGRTNEIYIGDLAGVEDVSGGGAGKQNEDFVLREGQAIKDSVSSFIESFIKKQRKTCFSDDAFKKNDIHCNLKGPIEFLTKDLFTDEEAKLMIVACFDPATTNGKVRQDQQNKQNKQNDIKRKIMQLNASVLTSLFKE
jgi:hypothetical protein